MKTSTYNLQRFIALIVFLTLISSAFSQTSPHTMDNNANFIVPPNVYSITVEAWGGGGGGYFDNNAASSGGGGGGAYTRGTLSVSPGDYIWVQVGPGGGQNSAGQNSYAGSIIANGGSAGVGRNGGAGGAAQTIAGNILASYKGGDGGDGRNSANGNNNEAGGGGGGSAYFNTAGNPGSNGFDSTNTATAGGAGTGNGGRGAAADGNPGALSGSVPGGGGGGRGEGGGGIGSGAKGRVIISWAVSLPNMQVTGINGEDIDDGDDDGDLSTSRGTIFGSTTVNDGTIQRTFTIKNNGSGVLGITSVVPNGDQDEDFTVTIPPASSVPPGGTTTFTVTFAPSATGNRDTTIRIYSNDPYSGAYYTFYIRGTGITPEINLRGNSSNIGNGDGSPSLTDHTDFDSVDVSSGTVTRTFTIQNTNTNAATRGALTIGTINLSGAAAGDFTVTDNPASTVNAGNTTQSTTFQVTFNPSATGIRNALISIPNNDIDEDPYTFAIRGNGITPEINLVGNSVNIVNADGTPDPADHTSFGSIDVSSGTIVRTFTIQNTNTSSGTRGPLNIGTITFSGAAAGDFSVTTLPASTVNAGSSTQWTTFQVTFNPSAAGIRNAVISIPNNDINENPYTFALSGTGIESVPEINLTGNGNNIATGAAANATYHTDFGSQNVTSGSITRTYTIQNLGGQNLTIGTVTISGPGMARYRVTQAVSSSVPGSGSTTFTVTYNPNATGAHSAVVTIPNNDSNENPYIFNITGTGTLPEINLTGNGNNILPTVAATTTNHTDFGSQNVTSGTVVRTFTIHNVSGSGPLTVGTITVSGAGSADYAISQPASTTIAVGSSVTFTITFNPSVAGIRAAIISIPNDDSDENPYTFNITGLGAGPEIDVRGNTISITDGDTSPATIDGTLFVSQHIHTGSGTQTFTIHNLGTAPLTLTTTISITGTDAADFTIVTPPTSPVASGGSTSFTVLFNPGAAGLRTATLSISNNDSDENPYNFSISGNGTLYLDSDRDGVTDEIDIDDDNDGILDTLEQSQCVLSPNATSVYSSFLNETFGAGTTATAINANLPATTTYTYESGTGDINDGTYSVRNTAQHSSWAPEYWHRGKDHTGDTNGKMAIFNATIASGEFYRTTITGITPNIPVRYSFWVLNLDRVDAPGIANRYRPNVKVEFRKTGDNSLITSLSTGNIAPTINTTGAGSWYNFYSEFTTTETSFKVIFINNTAGGLGNDLALDDIVITQKYCDMDNDLNADVFDLDDDNDGIADIVEAGFKAYSGNKSRMDTADLTVWADVNGNGLNDLIDPAYIGLSAYMSMIRDSDGDGVYDFMDLDSDNDSIFDIDEAHPDTFTTAYNGDGDIDGDGKGDGTDSDEDGIKDANDDFAGYGTSFRAYPTDSDGDGRADYIDTKSDGVNWDIHKSGIYSVLDADNDGVIDSSTDADKDGVMASLDGDDSIPGSPRNLTGKKLMIDFDGRNDYAEATQILSNLSRATIMGWVKLDALFANEARIAGQDNFYIGVNASKQLTAAAGTNSFTFTTTPLTTDRWYHVAAVYEGSNLLSKLQVYINGRLVGTNSNSLLTQLPSSSAKFTIAKNAGASNRFFRGFIDEVRVFNKALTAEQIQKMVCQEIKQNGSAIRGEIIAKDIESILWTDLIAYFKMDNYKADVIDNHTTSTIDSGLSTSLARIYNVKYLKTQSAPMPFETTANTSLESSISDPANYIIGTDIDNYPSAIINVKHNVTLNSNQSNVGMVIDAGKTLTLGNDNKIQNSWYLEVNGKIDLQGKSQLIQTSESTFSGTGIIERDQQGTTNLYNYNYWSSPVSSGTSNGGFNVNSVMKNGTVPSNPVNLQWTGDANSYTTGNAVTLSDIWIYKYQSNAAGWEYAGPNGGLSTGQGYTMKGSAAETPTQNYVFTGKPNNGTITVPVGSGSLSLVGNPYPSAIEAEQFIRDNLPLLSLAANPGSSGALNGNLYFWEHAPSNNSHNFASYQGSYALRNLTGYTLPVAAAGIFGTGGNTRYAREFIPVGQGFFVEAATGGGNITFKNSQRQFQKEDSLLSNFLFRSAAETNNNENDPYEAVLHPKIRLGFESPDGYHRQLLLGFMGNEATDGYDIGYDAENFDAFPCDMSFIQESKMLVIQGVGELQQNATYKLNVLTNVAAPVKFSLDAIENFDSSQTVYIYDSVTQTYHDITAADFEITLDAGNYADRFSLRFINQTLGIEELPVAESLAVAFSNYNNLLSLKSSGTNEIKSVNIYTVLGQQISFANDINALEYSIELNNVSSGTYIVKVQTNIGIIAKKIVKR